MEHSVVIYKNGTREEFKVKNGTNLLELLRKSKVIINTPCGGNGTCGKCKVKIEGTAGEPSEMEIIRLGDEALGKGFRLACYVKVTGDITVTTDTEDREAVVQASGKERHISLNPIVKKEFIRLDKPSINDQRADADRLDLNINVPAGMETEHQPLQLGLLRNMESVLRNNNFEVTKVSSLGKTIAVEAGNTAESLYGIAVDIGTTTIAGYLVNLTTGEKIDVYSELNPQKSFGADVVTRINHTINSNDALEEMNSQIINCINDMVNYFVLRNKIIKENIYSITFAGNTTMLHLLMKLPPRNLAVSPFIPVTTQMHEFGSNEFGIKINPLGRVIVFPSVSAYVGGDTVAAVLSSGMYEDDEICLLVDLGTNGEIVLGCKEWLYSCSTAAGPAFEGANIRNGTAGIKGAVDKISFVPDFHYTTVLDGKPIGICGSGIVDTVAGMLDAQILDETGRIQDKDELENEAALKLSERITDIDGQPAFILVPQEECVCDTDIAITQKDVRELQNAKAAIAAGIKVLIKAAGITTNNISKVYLAGGFGSYINIKSAVKIGLLPEELHDKIESIGNAAGMGAYEGLVCSELLEEACRISRKINYVELSARPDFMEEYIECMLFGKDS